jgi:hypothetical protein
VQHVGLDPVLAVYVFAPAGVGLLAALVTVPYFVGRFGEFVCSAAGFLFVNLSLLALGLVDVLTPALTAANPLPPLSSFGVGGGEMRTTALVAVPLGYGLTMTTTAVAIAITRRVLQGVQGQAFALLNMLRAFVSIPPLLVAGAVADVLGVKATLVASSLAFLLLGVFLVRVVNGKSTPRFDRTPAAAP